MKRLDTSKDMKRVLFGIDNHFTLLAKPTEYFTLCVDCHVINRVKMLLASLLYLYDGTLP